MAEAVKIQAEARDPAKNKGTGTRVARRLRRDGRVPAIVYGHKQAPVPITVSRETVAEMLKRSTHLAELSVGDTTETVLVRDVQWDHLGKEIIHLDFARVSADESIETDVRLEIRGVAPGLAGGGTLEVLHHELNVTCRAAAIPESIRVDVGQLGVDQGIHVKDLVLPEGLVVNADPDMLLVHVVTRAPEQAETTEAEGTTQPEVIKPERKEKED